MKAFGKEIPTSVLVVILVISGIGATVGVVTTGAIDGESTTDVDQALVIDAGDSGFGSADGVFQVSAGNSSFVTGATVNQGGNYDIQIALDNRANANISARLKIDNPTPLHIEAVGNNNIGVQRIGETEFLLDVPEGVSTGDNERIDLTVSAPNDISPGFYTFEATVAPVTVGAEVR